VTIVVGYSANSRGQRALDEAKTYARVHRLPLHVIRYVPHEVGESPTKVREDLKASEAAEEALQALRDQLAAEGFDVTTEVLHGMYGGAAEALLSEAERVDAELIVIGVRRRSAVDKLLLGSVAQEVLLRANCPVLAVKADR
jgi:nucleotide-binding universal stress UspA family protein